MNEIINEAFVIFQGNYRKRNYSSNFNENCQNFYFAKKEEIIAISLIEGHLVEQERYGSAKKIWNNANEYSIVVHFFINVWIAILNFHTFKLHVKSFHLFLNNHFTFTVQKNCCTKFCVCDRQWISRMRPMISNSRTSIANSLVHPETSIMVFITCKKVTFKANKGVFFVRFNSCNVIDLNLLIENQKIKINSFKFPQNFILIQLNWKILV